jgi:modulator of FtsH protease
MPTYQSLGYAAPAYTRDQTRAVFGQVMGLVAVAVACCAGGAYMTRNQSGGSGLLFTILGLVCWFALMPALRRGHQQLATALLFGMGLLLGMGIGPILSFYAQADPGVLWQASASTAGFIGILGSYGYATQRDFSSWARGLFFALGTLFVVGLVLAFVHIPHANIPYCIAGLAIFGLLTVFDFNRLRRTSMDGAVLIAGSIFLDVLNVFLFMLRLLGGTRN